MAQSVEDLLANFSSQQLVTDEVVLRGSNLSAPQHPYTLEEIVITVPSNGKGILSHYFAKFSEFYHLTLVVPAPTQKKPL